MKKKIVWHLPYPIIGGAETLYAVILKFIDKDKYDHFVTCPNGIKAWCLNKFKGNATVIDFAGAEDLAPKLRTLKPDLIMGTHGGTLYRALDINQSNIPVIEIVHGSHIWVEHNVKMPKDWTKHVVCVSNTAERVYLKNSNFGIPTSVIINGVDTDVFKPVKPLQRHAKVISYMGRFLECDKHVKKIIEAFKAVRDNNARLYLVGGNAQEIVHLKHFSRSLKVEPYIKFFEHSDSPQKYFEQIDLFTVRSEAEGYCNSAAEALATGTPLVCYNFGGILEHVPPGTIAVANSQPEYAKLLRDVFIDYDLRKKMSLMGLDFINREGNARIMSKRYESLIGSIIESGPVTLSKAYVPKVKEVQLPGVKASVKNSRPIVGVCNLHWHGIATATKNICDKIVSWYSDPALIASKVAQEKPRAVLFSGMCPGFDSAMRILKKKNPEIPIYGYYHGGISHYSFQKGLFGPGETEAFKKMLCLVSEGVIKKIAVSSPGLAEVLKASGYPAVFCGNIVKHVPDISVPTLPGLNIGNWNRHQDHKHTTIGMAVAQLYPNAKVHCLAGYPEIPGINSSKIVSHSEMPQPALYQKYAQMSVNLQMSFIETFNISVLEMWACKRPVMVGPGNFVLVDGSPLRDITMVMDHTNPVAIKDQIDYVLSIEKEVICMQTDMLHEHNKNSSNRWEQFFL